MRISDELLELLGNYFIEHNVRRYKVTFQQFVEVMVRNNWVHELKMDVKKMTLSQRAISKSLIDLVYH